MSIKARNPEILGGDPDIMAAAIRQIADKSRFGVFYYLFGLFGLFLGAPTLELASPEFIALLILFLLLAGLRELAYRWSRRDDSFMLRTQRCLEASYLLNALAWGILSFVILHAERSLTEASAALVITTAGLTAGGVTAIVPHLTLIRRYAVVMMGTNVILLPAMMPSPAVWYVCSVCVLFVVFLFGMGRRQSAVYWQLFESNQALKRQTTKLAAAQVEAVAGARAKSEFLANMSHEIRTPMNGVIGMAQLLEKTLLNDQQRSYLKIIQDAGTTLLTIINDILDFSKLEANKMKLAREPVDLDALVRNLHKLFALQLKDSQVRLHYEHGAQFPRWVLADPARLRQVLYNLIGNAIKFTPQGSITVRLESLATDSSASPEVPGQCRMRFSVRDTGIGIADKDRPQVFAKFGQIGNLSSTKGTGLGLAISKHLVELMGGEIGFDSTPGEGSHFWFELPLEIVAAPSPAEHPVALSGSTVNGGDILLVEDNPTNQVVAQGMLEHCGCRVQFASSGEEAIDAVREKSFDLVLMDCDLPGIDGFAATRSIRDWETQHQQPHTPIIALTAHVLESARERCRDAGMDDYLAKPLHFQELEATVRRWAPSSSA